MQLLVYLGMHITRDRQNRIIRLGQQSYLQKVLEEFEMTSSKPQATPMDTSKAEAAPESFQRLQKPNIGTNRLWDP